MVFFLTEEIQKVDVLAATEVVSSDPITLNVTFDGRSVDRSYLPFTMKFLWKLSPLFVNKILMWCTCLLKILRPFWAVFSFNFLTFNLSQGSLYLLTYSLHLFPQFLAHLTRRLVSFSDQNLSVVVIVVDSSSEPLDQYQLNLTQSILGKGDSSLFNEGPRLFPRDNYEVAKKYLQHFKIFSWTPFSMGR